MTQRAYREGLDEGWGQPAGPREETRSPVRHPPDRKGRAGRAGNHQEGQERDTQPSPTPFNLQACESVIFTELSFT